MADSPRPRTPRAEAVSKVPEKNTYTQIGIGNPFNEVCERLDSA